MFLSNMSRWTLYIARVDARQKVTQRLLSASEYRSPRQFYATAIVLLGCLALSAQVSAEIAVNIEISDHIARDGHCSFVVSLSGSPSVRSSELKESVKLQMPGFSDIRISEAGSNKLAITATISEPGFYPFRVIFRTQGGEQTAADY